VSQLCFIFSLFKTAATTQTQEDPFGFFSSKMVSLLSNPLHQLVVYLNLIRNQKKRENILLQCLTSSTLVGCPQNLRFCPSLIDLHLCCIHLFQFPFCML
jgi:hypothetical protein